MEKLGARLRAKRGIDETISLWSDGKPDRWRILPVEPRRFFTSTKYVANPESLWPEVVNELCEINSGKYQEVIATGGIGPLSGDTEFLTPSGWVRMDAWDGHEVGEYDLSTGTVMFRIPEKYEVRPCGGMLHFRTKYGVDMKLSHHHRVLYRSSSSAGGFVVATAEEVARRYCKNRGGFKGAILTTFSLGERVGVRWSNAEIRLMVAVQADGSFDHRRLESVRCRVYLKKLRKKKRLRELLRAAGVSYRERRVPHRGGYSLFTFAAPLRSKSLADWAWGCSTEQLRVLTDEVNHWDGSFSDSRYATADKASADVVQFAYAATGRRASIRNHDNSSSLCKGAAKRMYRVRPSARVEPTLAGRSGGVVVECDAPGGKMYCFGTRTGFFIARHNDHIFITGNSAKSTVALYSCMYQLYLVACMRDPHEEYGLDQSSEIVLIFQSRTEKLARTVDFNRFRQMVNTSPWFCAKFPCNPRVQSKLVFPGRIEVQPLSGDATAALGQNVIGGMIDEVNDMLRVAHSALTYDNTEYDQVWALYNAISRRRKTRFTERGALPGLLFLVGSRKYPGEFTDLKEEEARHDKSIYVYNKRVWDVKPKEKFRPSWFRVFVGDQGRKPRILEDGEHADKFPLGTVEKVPDDFRRDFERDIYNALRDITGVATMARWPFFTNVDAVAACFGKRRSILSCTETDLHKVAIRALPKLFERPEEPRAAHIDIGIIHDALGLTIGWVPGFVRKERGAGRVEVVPQINIDCTLRVVPPRHGEIEIWRVRKLLLALRDAGLNIRWVTLDSFQSKDTIQILRRESMICGIVSMDRDDNAYSMLKACMYDGRVAAPKDEYLQRELLSLEFDPQKGRVDHTRYCFTGDTRVALVNGTCPTMQELAEAGEEFYTYAMASHGMVVARAEAMRSRKVCEIVEVMLDNFQVVRCTPEHLFMTLDGEWVQAQHLTPDIRLMPLYRSRPWTGGSIGREYVWCPVRRERLWGHHLQYESGRPPRGRVVHHVDGNPVNNYPDNLREMGRREHHRLHGVADWEGGRAQKMREGHHRYRERDRGETSRRVIRESWAAGKFGPRRGKCSIEGCEQPHTARGLCDRHYQRAKRAGRLPGMWQRGAHHNHRVLSVVRVRASEWVYDVSVPGLENFALAAGVFVHNSTKDVSDSLAGVVWTLVRRPETYLRYDVPIIGSAKDLMRLGTDQSGIMETEDRVRLKVSVGGDSMEVS